MKKTSLIIFSALLCLTALLCACEEGNNASSSDNSSKTASEVISSPSEALSGEELPEPTSTPERGTTSVEDSAPDVSAPDVSTPDDTSVPDDTSTPDDTSSPENKPDSYDGLMPIPVDSVRAAKGYRVAYTKESPLSATECITNCNIKITAIYDGSVTRFFDAVNGTYYHAVAGKYLYPCCEGTFLAGDLNSYNGDYSITFSRDKEDSSIVSFTTNNHDGHGLGDVDAIYCAADEKIYFYDHALYRVDGDGAVACRYYSGSSPLNAYIQDSYVADIIDDSAIGKYGIVKNGGIIVPFEYDLILSGQDEEGVGVYMAKKNGRTYYISSDGFVLTPDGFDCGSQPCKNRAWVFDGGQGYMLEFN